MTTARPSLDEVNRQIDHLTRAVVAHVAPGAGALVAVEVGVPDGWADREVRALIERRLAEHGLDFVDVTGGPSGGDALTLVGVQFDTR